eukprot:Pgem_evm1s257
MYASHWSLSKDFDVSTNELDELVKIATSCEGVYGSRMTGGGFGGCTVTLVEKSKADSLVETIHAKYSQKATCFYSGAGIGAQVEF